MRGPRLNLKLAVCSWSFAIVITGGLTSARDQTKASTEDEATLPLVVTEEGERLVKALTTTNRAPRLFRQGEGLALPFFPTSFNWKEYARVRAAIKELESNSAAAWPSVVEHMTDPEYCFTVEAYGSAHNRSRGGVCYEVCRSWVNRGYADLMPMDRPLYQYQAPNDMDAAALQRWCRARRDKPIHKIQIEAAEWALSIIPAESKMPNEIQERATAEIKSRIATLRETRKSIPGKFFVTDVICPFAESDAAKFREMAK